MVCALGRGGWGLLGRPTSAWSIWPLWSRTPGLLNACRGPRLVLFGVSWLWDEVLAGWVCEAEVAGGSDSSLLALVVELVPFKSGVEAGSGWVAVLTLKCCIIVSIYELHHNDKSKLWSFTSSFAWEKVSPWSPSDAGGCVELSCWARGGLLDPPVCRNDRTGMRSR